MCNVVSGWEWILHRAENAAKRTTVIFFRTVAPVEPVSFVKQVCEAAMREPDRKRTRFAKRLSPMTLMGRASPEGLDKVAREVLAPHFHQAECSGRKVRRLVPACPPNETGRWGHAGICMAGKETLILMPNSVCDPTHSPQPQCTHPRHGHQADRCFGGAGA